MRFNLASEKMPTSWFNALPRLPEPRSRRCIRAA